MVKHPDDPMADLLRAHLRAARACEELSSPGAVNMQDKAMAECLEAVEQHEVDCPTSVKQMLVQREVNRWSSRPDKYERTEEMLNVIRPWADRSNGEDESDDFKTKAPLMRCVEGSQLDKAHRWKEYLVNNLLLPILKTGEAGLAECERLSAAVIAHIEGAGEADEAYETPMNDMLILFRCVLSIVKGYWVEGCDVDELSRFERSVADKGSNNVIGAAAATIMEVDAYKQKKKELREFAATTKMHLPRIRKSMEELRARTGPVSATTLSAHLDTLGFIEGKVSDGLREDLACVVEAAVKEAASYEVSRLASGEVPSADAALWTGVLQSYMNIFGNTEEVASLLAALRARESDLNQKASLQAFADACKAGLAALTPFGPCLDPASMAALIETGSAIKDLRAPVKDNDIDNFMTALAKEIASCEAPDNLAGAAQLFNLLEEVSFVAPVVRLSGCYLPTKAVFAVSSRIVGLFGLAPTTADLGAISDDIVASLHACMLVFDASSIELGEVWRSQNFFQKATQKLSALASKIAEAAFQKQLTEIEACEAALKPIAAGGENGESWTIGLEVDPNTTLKTLHSHAELTLLRASGKQVTTAAENMAAALARWKHLCELHGTSVQSKVKDHDFAEENDLVRRARATTIEAILITKFSADSMTSMKAKGIALSNIKRATAWGCLDLLQPNLLAATQEATMARFKWA